MARASRNSQNTHPTREEDTRAEVWTPPAVLDAPPAREGMRQRGVATSILGEPVPHHTTRRFREGWTPRPSDTVPEDFPVPTIAHGEHEGCIGVEGMILCEMPEERVEARKRYFKQKTGDLNTYVENQLNKVERSGGVAIDRDMQSSYSRGPGRVASD